MWTARSLQVPFSMAATGHKRLLGPLNTAREAEGQICALHFVLRNLLATQGWRFQQEQQSTLASWLWAGWGERTLSDQGVPGRGGSGQEGGASESMEGSSLPM